jgi:hypothetical protein
MALFNLFVFVWPGEDKKKTTIKIPVKPVLHFILSILNPQRFRTMFVGLAFVRHFEFVSQHLQKPLLAARFQYVLRRQD